jgi:RNA polymerase sigma-70 factor, ECF subfamily
MLNFVPWPARALDTGADAVALVARVVRGERAALEALYRREAGAVYRYALALCGNEAWAADATQDAFASFAQNAAAFDAQRGSLGAYLAGAARHSLLALWRRARAEVALQNTDADDAEPDEDHADAAGAVAGQAADPEALLVRVQSTRELWRALHRLPFIYREPIVLVDLQERAYAEAARIAGIELNTLRTRLHRGRLRLAQLLGAGVPA